MSAGEPDPDWILLDRMLGIAEWQQIPVALCLNKLDLADEAWADRVMRPYKGDGVSRGLYQYYFDAGSKRGVLRSSARKNYPFYGGFWRWKVEFAQLGCNPDCSCVRDLLVRPRARVRIRRRIRSWSLWIRGGLSAICRVFESFIYTI